MSVKLLRASVLVGLLGLGLSGSALSAEQNIAISDFSKLEVLSAFELELRFAAEPSLVFTGEQACLEQVVVQQEKHKLRLSSKELERDSWWSLGSDHHECRIQGQLTLTHLSSLEVSGASQLEILSPWHEDDIEIEAAGASQIRIDELKTDRLELELEGASQMTIKALNTEVMDFEGAGAVQLAIHNALQLKKLSLELAGASQMNAKELSFDQGEIELAGASQAHLGQCGHVKAEVVGASQLRVESCRSEELEVSGVSSFSKRSGD